MMTRACCSGENSPTASRATPSVSDLQSSPAQVHPPLSRLLHPRHYINLLGFLKIPTKLKSLRELARMLAKDEKSRVRCKNEERAKENTGNCRCLRAEMSGDSSSFRNELKAHGN